MPSCIRPFATLWTAAHQAPLSRGFPRQEYRSGLPFHSPGDLPHPGTEPVSLVSPALAGRFFFLPLSHQGSSINATVLLKKIMDFSQMTLFHFSLTVTVLFQFGVCNKRISEPVLSDIINHCSKPPLANNSKSAL